MNLTVRNLPPASIIGGAGERVELAAEHTVLNPAPAKAESHSDSYFSKTF